MTQTVGILVEPGTEREFVHSHSELARRIKKISADVQAIYIDRSHTLQGDEGVMAHGIYFPHTEGQERPVSVPIAIPLAKIAALHTNGQPRSQTAPELCQLQREIPTINRMVPITTASGEILPGMTEAIAAIAKQLPFGRPTSGEANILVANGKPCAHTRLDSDGHLAYIAIHRRVPGVTEAKALLAILSSEMGAAQSDLVFSMSYVIQHYALTITGLDMAPQRMPAEDARGVKGVKNSLMIHEARALVRLALSAEPKNPTDNDTFY